MLGCYRCVITTGSGKVCHTFLNEGCSAYCLYLLIYSLDVIHFLLMYFVTFCIHTLPVQSPDLSSLYSELLTLTTDQVNNMSHPLV